MSRRRATDLCGIILIDKPSGLTSHDIVNQVRRISGEGRVGHAGTLDPMATGLLVILVGSATRLARYLTSQSKTYTAQIAFGLSTDTDDAQGEVIEQASVPNLVLEKAFAARYVEDLIGDHIQVPPIYSAIKIKGKKAYAIARKGGKPQLDSRKVVVEGARLLAISAAPTPLWEVELTVSKGTYIRSLARDMGLSLGTRAHLAALRRVRSGAVGVKEAVTVESLQVAKQPVRSHFIDPVSALGLPVVRISPEQALKGWSGMDLDEFESATSLNDDVLALVVSGAQAVGVFMHQRGVMRPVTVLPFDTPLAVLE